MRPSLNVLGEDLILRILDEARRILAETGMEIRGRALRERLLERGLPSDAANGRILFPADIVEKAIGSAPSRFSLYDRDGNPHAELGGDATLGVEALDGPVGGEGDQGGGEDVRDHDVVTSRDLGQRQVVDLDGPLLLAEDRDTPLVYDAAGVHPPAPELWG